MSDEDSSSPIVIETEHAPLRLPNPGPPHAGDATCIVIPSRSLTASLRTPIENRSRTNSLHDETEVTNDLIIF